MAGDPAIGDAIVGTQEMPGTRRLDVYVNAYYVRLIEALRSDYTALAALLGDDEFARICGDYVRAYPSHYFSLRWFGQYLPLFLRTGGEPDSDLLAELATFEWAFVDAFDAPDVALADESAAASVPFDAWPALCIEFHPSLRTVELHWNSLEIWKAARASTALPQPQRAVDAVTCLVWRPQLLSQFRMLDADEAAALAAARDGADFAAMCEALSDWHDDDAALAVRAASLLKTWLAAGMIQHLHT